MATRPSDATQNPRTVVGVDGSEHARTAMLWGAADAARHRRRLLLVHAADLDRLDRFASFETSEHLRDNGNAVLTTAAEEIRERFPELDVDVKLSRRKPVPALHASVRPGSTIVVGSRGSGGFGPLLLGSTGLEVVVGSPAPVVVVRGEFEREDAPVTAAVRDEHDARWLVRAGQEAQARNSPLRLVSVRGLLARFGGTARDEAGGSADPDERLLADLASRIHESAPGLAVRTEVVAARSAASALVDASRHAGLLVMGSHERRGASVLGLGHVVHALLHHSRCPVQIVPYRHDEERGVVEEGLRDDEG
ncbi:universal stress protein [Streptomyces sp. JH34]|uniref:universal stress protein n=1 Tax=Streptomyces sp. JH34 TaxID=2793633 RepID=UPI0023F67EB4|nr:universal stress protein [Streptomyces sp. JH34]MDF6017397.1 universal stress protein [Streptomyces sp. JH34]